MTLLYEVGLLGKVSSAMAQQLSDEFAQILKPMRLQKALRVTTGAAFTPSVDFASAAIYFGSTRVSPADEKRLTDLMNAGTPVLPVVDDLTQYSSFVPQCLHSINGLQRHAPTDSVDRMAATTLELLGLLPKQRRVFLSYRQAESREAALQLFEYLSSRRYDVFLDTHGVPPAADFQEVLWHRLSDCDVLLMLDTKGYFKSRWTREEFGRALAHSLVPIRLGWPGVKPDKRILSGESIQFSDSDFDPATKRFTPQNLAKVARAVEKARSRGIATRTSEMKGSVVAAVKKIGGKFVSIGPCRTMVVELPSSHRIMIYPCLGVPTAEHLHEASLLKCVSDSRAVVFDDFALARRWQEHLSWLGGEVKSAKLLKKARAAADLAVWGEAP